MSSSLSAIRVAIILAVLGAGYFGYQRVAPSSASAHDRAVAYLTQQPDAAAKLGHARFTADSISCGSTGIKPTSQEASRLGSGVSLVDCTATTLTGQVEVMCVGVGGKLKGSGVGLLSSSHCADIGKVFAASPA
jgi:hypothetical protein